MVVSTKVTDKVPVSEARANRLALVARLQERYDALEASFQRCIKDKRWIELEGGKYYYVPEDSLILPNTRKVAMDATAFVKLPKLNWQEMTEYVAKKWFWSSLKTKNPMIASKEEEKNIDYSYCIVALMDYHGVDNRYEICCRLYYRIYCNGRWYRVYDNCWDSGASITHTDCVKIPIYTLTEAEKKQGWLFFVEHDLPFCSGDDAQKCSLLAKFCQEKLLKCTEQGALWYIDDDESYAKACQICEEQGCDSLCRPAEPSATAVSVSDKNYLEEYRGLLRDLLDCDKVRVNMDSYPEIILHDPAGGHWELWENGNAEHTATLTTSKLMARNPVYDALANKSGVVGIDFGTKSTVVTCARGGERILPLRIGCGQFSRAVARDDYENPTIMELRNIPKFIAEYGKYEGRPSTHWEDLLISHEAAGQLKSEQSEGVRFASFFSELKQWTSDASRQIHLRDKDGNYLDLPAYVELSEGDFDPIEVYAYYLGLFINNMVHKIYLRYKLSFPATVEKQVRDKVLASFTRGLKKSLPVQVLHDDSCMKIFKVVHGASEPAAYAITALEAYGFNPGEDGDANEKYYYGIFDFGGGTTDFDFGVFSPEDEDTDNYDYQISHFDQGSDTYLGGERLLELLSYHVFSANYDKLLQDEIVFVRPVGELESAGHDYLIRQNSLYAHFNHRRMMEKLRGVWEGDDETREALRSGTVSLNLFGANGETQANYALKVNLEELDGLLQRRIDKGVSQFFKALQSCFGDPAKHGYIYNSDGLHIFLAGNSSKSPLVYKAFKEHIELLAANLGKEDSITKECLKIYPPLGTALADAVMEGTLLPNIDDIIAYIDKSESVAHSKAVPPSVAPPVEAGELLGAPPEEAGEESAPVVVDKPTGKTGVAYGLLNTRVRVVQNEAEEINFRYYIGRNKRHKFYCVIDKDNQKYNVWVKFCAATREEFDIWFTRSSEALCNNMLIDQVGVYCEPGFVEQPSADKAVFIRLVSPTDIEYVVASETEISENSYDAATVQRLALQEK